MSKVHKQLGVGNQNKVKVDTLIGSLILILYGCVTILVPEFQVFDMNGPKFLAISILNLLVFIYLFVKKREKLGFSLFLQNKVGAAYSFLIFLSLLSFFKALNVNESILHFSKIITVFIASWLISVVISSDKKVLSPFLIAMTVLLLFDCLSVFFGISDYISNKISHINNIKSVYSNKNILTASLFFKIPFSIVLFLFYKGNTSKFGLIVFFLSILATLFMSSRAFYLGLGAFFIMLLFFLIFSFRKSKRERYKKNIIIVSVVFIGALLLFSIIQSNVYPKQKQQETGLVSRIASIGDTQKFSNNSRLTAWGQSIRLIKREPILGVGLGNWKIRILEYENKYSKNYTYMYKAHNDFLEITAESGLLAGISFVLMFFFIFFDSLKRVFNNNDENSKLYFLLIFCIVAYFFDAFFNFPQDRAEVQALFALIVGISIGLFQKNIKNIISEQN